MANFTKLFENAKDLIAKKYAANPAKMLIQTGVAGWILSCAAQVCAIIFNDKLSTKQKMYLVPQEIADGAVNIASFYLITQSFKSIASKLVNSGKWLSKPVRDFLNTGNFKNVGNMSFDVLRDAKPPEDITKKFKSFRNGIDLIATTVGSVISCNLVTPIIRNEIAANRQQKGIAKLNKNQENQDTMRIYSNLPRPTIYDFQQKNTYPRFYPNLKI